jgi:hypothetical protein
MEKLNVEALLRAADLIDYDQLVNLEVWQHSGYPTNNVYQRNACGYIACIVGHCMVDSWFNERGLFCDDNLPSYDGDFGLVAVQRFFGLTETEANKLFIGSNESGSKLAKKIRNFVEKKKAGEAFAATFAKEHNNE